MGSLLTKQEGGLSCSIRRRRTRTRGEREREEPREKGNKWGMLRVGHAFAGHVSPRVTLAGSATCCHAPSPDTGTLGDSRDTGKEESGRVAKTEEEVLLPLLLPLLLLLLPLGEFGFLLGKFGFLLGKFGFLLGKFGFLLGKFGFWLGKFGFLLGKFGFLLRGLGFLGCCSRHRVRLYFISARPDRANGLGTAEDDAR